MRSLVDFCLQMRWLMVLAAVGLMGLGVSSARSMSVDAFPEFAPPLVEVQTEAPGLSSIEIEQLVTQPLENALNGTPRLKKLRSKSVLGLSSVVMFFDEGVGLFEARQFVQERLSRASTQMPQAARAPVMLSPLSATSRVMKVGMTSDTHSQMELSDLATWTVRPALLAVPGVANVAIWGQRDRQLQIEVDPERAGAMGVRFDEVQAAVRASVQPTPGGFVDTPNQRMAVVHQATAIDVRSMADVVLRFRNGAAIRLGDVATLREGPPPAIGDAVINGRDGLLLIVEKQPWGNTLEVTKKVERALAAMAPAMRGVSFDDRIFRPATFVERSLANLGEALAIGCGLVVLVIFAFLFDWRTAVISVATIPLSLAGAVAVMHAFGLTLDTMAIAGLSIALGEVVDDAIIDVENILRRLRENRAVGSPRSTFSVVLDASVEVRSAVVYASLIVGLVFVPVYYLDGLAGSFFRPLARAYVLAVGTSLLVALTLTPALALLFLGSSSERRGHSPVATWARKVTAPLVRMALGRPRAVLATLGAAFAATALVVPLLGESFLPHFKESDFLMHWVAKPGTSLESVRRTTLRVGKELLTVPGVRHMGSHIGRAEVADEVVGPNFAELWISLDDGVDHDTSVRKIHEIVEGYPGLTRDVQTYLQERVKEVLTGASGAIVVRIYGPDLGSLRDAGAALAKQLAPIEGLVNLKVEPQVLVPQINVRLRPDAAVRLGITQGELERMTTALLQGTRVGQIYREGRPIDVVVQGPALYRNEVAVLRDLPLPVLSGSLARLGDLADVEIVPAPNVVQREGSSRRLDVTCDARGRDLGAVVRDVQAVMAKVPLAPGHRAELLGEWEARSSASKRLLLLSLAALVGIAAVLYADFRSVRVAGLVFATLPFALVGGVAAVAVTGAEVSLGSVVGFVTVLGVAARNGIMLVSHFRHLEHEEGVPFGRELVLRGTLERVAPVLMTALATGLALVPLALRGDRPGYEIEHPMAVVILGGLVSSTLMNLLLLPSLYLRLAPQLTHEQSPRKA